MDEHDIIIKNISYLRARDPSILSLSVPRFTRLDQVRTNLLSTLESTTDTSQPDENIRIFLRIKPCNEPNNLYKIDNQALTCHVPPDSHCMRNVRAGDTMRKIYTFSQIFPPETTQAQLFNSVVKQKVLDFINGENSTLLTYGVSGSGKTFTVIGTDEEPGLVPRCLEYLFRTLPQLIENPKVKPHSAGSVTVLQEADQKREQYIRRHLLNASSIQIDRAQHIKTYTAMQKRLSSEPVALLEEHSHVSLSIWVTFAEIYNEKIYDLLTDDPPRGRQRPQLRLGASNGNSYIKNLTHINVSSGLEAFQILQYGIHNINYAPTKLNSHSSRSHSIFTIKLVQSSSIDGGVHVSSFNFCDLAGCERTKKTMNVGVRLQESNNINSSLLVLGRCISAVRNIQKGSDAKLVPFRESKLTQLFQKALAGHEDIAMIVNISPRADMFDETQHVLNFSALAKDITMDRKQEPATVRGKGRFSQLVEAGAGDAATDMSVSLELGDVEELRNRVQELEEEKHQLEVQEKINRDYMVQGYQRIIKEMELEEKNRVRDAVKVVRLEYEAKISTMRERFEKKLREAELNSVILVADSSDEEEEGENAYFAVKELEEELAGMKKQVLQLRFDLELKDQTIADLRREITALKNDVMRKDEMMAEEISVNNALNAALMAKDQENVVLSGRCIHMGEEIEMLKAQANAAAELSFYEHESDDSGGTACKDECISNACNGVFCSTTPEGYSDFCGGAIPSTCPRDCIG